MRTYDTESSRLNVGTFWKNMRAVLRRWLDRERELVSLRNAVGMLSEARRADAAEYHEMRELNREMRADALRLRWLADDHADPEVRERVRSICQSIPTRSLSGVRLDIDAIMRAQRRSNRPWPQQEQR
jgi:hypothetical protein